MVMKTLNDIHDQCEVTLDFPHRGGQYVGMPEGTITLKHKETGITIILPPTGNRSQHKRLMAMKDAMEYLICSV